VILRTSLENAEQHFERVRDGSSALTGKKSYILQIVGYEISLERLNGISGAPKSGKPNPAPCSRISLFGI